MNEPSASLWKKLNEVSDRLQKVSEQLIEAKNCFLHSFTAFIYNKNKSTSEAL